MFSKIDEEYIIRALSRQNAILFLGSGFSSEATNKEGSPLPFSSELSEKLWRFMDFDEPYDNSSLQEVYQAVLDSGKKHSEIEDFLNKTLLVEEYPQAYLSIARIYWYRIYTTNIDDLLDEIFLQSKQIKPEIICYPYDDPTDVDQTLEKVQLIYLHGKLPCSPDDLIFSTNQYAFSSNIHNPLYECFLRDYFTKPTIFIGSSLNEPLFWQYLVARQSRERKIGEYRAKSFVIAPKISHAKNITLKKYNTIPVETDVIQFLDWLTNKLGVLPGKHNILKITAPSIAEMLDFSKIDSSKSLIEFSKSFDKVPIHDNNKNINSDYLLGKTPNWTDIHNNLDAPRTITNEILSKIEGIIKSSGTEVQVFALLGSAGSGKSTILRRLGLRLAQSGRLVFLTNSEYIPRVEIIADVIKSLKEKVVLLIDNSQVALGLIPKLAKGLDGLKYTPILVFAARSNEFQRISGRFHPTINFDAFDIPNLNRDEIIEIIQILDQHNLLGKLRGMTTDKRIHEFEIRSRKQILVAMREATKGESFDEIIKNEFQTIVPREAKYLTLCTALATDAGFRITKEEFIACGEEKPANILHYLERNLKNIVVVSGPRENMLDARHRRIAEHYVNSCASQDMLKIAYIRILQSLANEILSSKWHTRQFKLYRTLVNHAQIYKRFAKKISRAREIYDAIGDYFRDDYHFWLQYGSLETEGGRLSLAENYLDQAESLNKNDHYILNAKANLFLKKGVEAKDFESAVQFRERGNEILNDLILSRGGEDAHCYHVYCRQNFRWIDKWITDNEEKKKEFEKLREKTKEAILSHPFNKRLQSFEQTLQRSYLSLGIK